MNSIKLQNKMNTIYVNSQNSKISAPHRLLLGLSEKINLKGSKKYVVPFKSHAKQ